VAEEFSYSANVCFSATVEAKLWQLTGNKQARKKKKEIGSMERRKEGRQAGRQTGGPTSPAAGSELSF